MHARTTLYSVQCKETRRAAQQHTGLDPSRQTRCNCLLCVNCVPGAGSGLLGGEVGGQNDPFKTAVIDTLVEQVQSVPGDDRAVVMLGYQEEMERMMKNVNPGLSRRFQLEYAFQFPDYDDTALTRCARSARWPASARRAGLHEGDTPQTLNSGCLFLEPIGRAYVRECLLVGGGWVLR